jgi:hypothetical protein
LRTSPAYKKYAETDENNARKSEPIFPLNAYYITQITRRKVRSGYAADRWGVAKQNTGGMLSA